MANRLALAIPLAVSALLVIWATAYRPGREGGPEAGDDASRPAVPAAAGESPAVALPAASAPERPRAGHDERGPVLPRVAGPSATLAHPLEHPPPLPGRTFWARVVSESDGLPVAYANVWLADGLGAWGYTGVISDAGGYFSFEIDPALGAQFGLSAAGFVSRSVYADAGHEERAMAREIALAPAGRLSVRLRDATGRSIEGLRIELEPEEGAGWQVPRDDLSRHAPLEGPVRFDGVAPDVRHWLSIWRGAELAKRLAEPIALSAGERRELEVWLGVGVEVRGRVVDPRGRAPAGLEVWLVPDAPAATPRYLDPLDRAAAAVARTDGTGRFAFTDVDPGAWCVGVAPARSSPWSALAIAFELTAGARVSDLRVSAHRDLAIQGRVEAADGRPVAGVEVLAEAEVARGRLIARSGPDGEFRIAPLSPGHFRLAAAQSPGDGDGAQARAEIVRVEAGAQGVVVRLP